ncbi:hypothetical protein GE061_007692 [Apolygus lucorum]|uniref:Reverse transcriptase domain-containing protein n=1 Tax=Apolygus lucorum TaxID=248454 RepID=A0A8S9WP19_APOLU|nr:hypothetical protein GE061_007692 [Apolygus lucorum]
MPVPCGVMQGSILDPCLFTLFINDLPYLFGRGGGMAFLFADDVTIRSVASSREELAIRQEEASVFISQWCTANALLLNNRKTQMGHSANFLGIVIDSRLSWSGHVEALLPRLASSSYMLFQLKSAVPYNSLGSVYFAYVESCISYGILLWGGSSHTEALFKLHKRILRTIFGLHPSESCRSYFKRLGATVYGLFVWQALLHVRESLNLFVTGNDVHNYGTRAGPHICPPPPFVRLTKSLTCNPEQFGTRKTFFFRDIKIWKLRSKRSTIDESLEI